MTHVSAFPGNSEIVEIEEFDQGEHYRTNNSLKPESRREEMDRRSLTSNGGNISSIEEDLNQLFEIFNRRASSHGSPHQHKASTSKKSTSKKPVKSHGTHSPGQGKSERVNLKQALRGLCLSQASEMAALKRSMKSPRSSEAGKIMTMYRNVVVEDIISDNSKDDSREGLLEISLVPDQTTFDSFKSIPEKLPASDLWPSNRTSLTDKAVRPTRMQDDRAFGSNTSGNPLSKPGEPIQGIRENEKPSSSADNASQTFWTESSQTGKCASPSSSSCSSYATSSLEIAGKSPAQKIFVAAAVEAGKRKSKVDMIHQDEDTHSSYSDDFRGIAWEDNKTLLTEIEKNPAAAVFSRDEPLRSSHPTSGKISLDNARRTGEQKERTSTSVAVRNQDKFDAAHKEEYTPTCSPRYSDLGDKFSDRGKNSADSSKVVGNKGVAALVKVEVKELGGDAQDILKPISSAASPKGKKVSRSTRNAQHLVKPLIKTKNFVKRRAKKKTTSDNSSKTVQSEFNNDLYSSPNSIVCPRCQCMVMDGRKEANNGSSLSHSDSPVSPEDSPVSPFASLSGEVSSGNVISNVSTLGPSSDGSTKSKTTLIDFCSTQSSKGSPGECSSKISIGQESTVSRPSFCDRPHMSKDVRWEAVRQVKFQHGTLGLQNFSLLKKLGCGDIGTVYLTELIGTNCLFAIKVMDNDFLARRKKIMRAQTEKEILRMLDHPFLPTLYCKFTSDNLSCLVMEYCPGGDLHVLRQRQPGRCFTEQAARFYVAEVLLALEYLHMLGVIYRDLKPENILVREDGHIMLSDFDLSLRCAVSPTLLVSSSRSEGSKKTPHDSHRCSDSRCAQPLCMEPSCQVTCFTPRHLSGSSKSRKMKPDMAAEMRPLLQLVAEPTTARSNSFVGTHEYLAPEIIKGEGHGSAVDWWTYGIFLYELLYGRTPFKGAGNEETLANVVLESLKFPDTPLVSLQARDLIATLLVKEPENRLGTERGATEIKQHPFFDGLNWALIRCTVPPELPEAQNYRTTKTDSTEKNNKYVEDKNGSGSGSGSAEHLEFEVF